MGKRKKEKHGPSRGPRPDPLCPAWRPRAIRHLVTGPSLLSWTAYYCRIAALSITCRRLVDYAIFCGPGFFVRLCSNCGLFSGLHSVCASAGLLFLAVASALALESRFHFSHRAPVCTRATCISHLVSRQSCRCAALDRECPTIPLQGRHWILENRAPSLPSSRRPSSSLCRQPYRRAIDSRPATTASTLKGGTKERKRRTHSEANYVPAHR